MRAAVFFTLVFGLLVTRAAFADTENDFQSRCAVCHGSKGEGNEALQSPALAGQSTAYMQRQILNYQSGLRGAHPDDAAAQAMVGIAATINSTDAEALSGYASSLVPLNSTAAEGDLSRGEKYYQSYCGSCHGAKAEGNELLNSPKLSILSAAYMQRQYDHFLQGVRGAAKADKFGRQMALIASGMKEPEIIKDMIAYITHLE